MVRELAVGNREMYLRYMRMTPDRKMHLLSLDAPLITKLSTNYGSPFPLSSGFRSLYAILLQENVKSPLVSNTAFIGRQTISKIIPDKCKTIYDALVANYVNTPLSHEDWLAISKQFEDRWNSPHFVNTFGYHFILQL